MRRFLVWLCAAVIRTICRSLRVTMDDRAKIFGYMDHPPSIIAFWHNRTFTMCYIQEHFHRRKTATFISISRDGQFMADVAAQFGIDAVRGSSSKRGGLAALNAIRAAENDDTDIVITPDGPRGPRYVIQHGVLRLAQTTGRPIVPLTCYLGWKYELRSWDRFQVPLPFATCRLVTREPIFVPADASDTEVEAIREKLTEAMGGDVDPGAEGL